MTRKKKIKDNSSLETLKGTVETLFFSSPNWSAGRIETDSGESVSFAGSLMIQVGDQVKLFGNWTKHPQYGRQFQVERFEYDMPIDGDGLVAYLANHPNIKGIGKVKAGEKQIFRRIQNNKKHYLRVTSTSSKKSSLGPLENHSLVEYFRTNLIRPRLGAYHFVILSDIFAVVILTLLLACPLESIRKQLLKVPAFVTTVSEILTILLIIMKFSLLNSVSVAHSESTIVGRGKVTSGDEKSCLP